MMGGEPTPGGPPFPTDRLPPGDQAAGDLPEAELHAAFAGAHIQALYQPLVRLSDRRPVGLEVLARLEHPSQGTLPPVRFVPPMEDAGLGWKLTDAVMRRAFTDWGDGRLAALDLTLALNLPQDVLLNPRALAGLDQARSEAGIPATSIIIELTESQQVERLPELVEVTMWLRSAGYGLAIDDVSPDVRDHRDLLGLPFTILKLDKDLVMRAPEDSTVANFLLRAVAAARAAGMLVIAEGIENEATWTRMEALGVDHAQGYLVGYPMTAAEILPWHRAWCDRHMR